MKKGHKQSFDDGSYTTYSLGNIHHLFYFVAAFYNYSLIQFGLSEKER